MVLGRNERGPMRQNIAATPSDSGANNHQHHEDEEQVFLLRSIDDRDSDADDGEEHVPSRASPESEILPLSSHELQKRRHLDWPSRPRALNSCLSAVLGWIQGPLRPQAHTISPIFGRAQTLHIDFLEKLLGTRWAQPVAVASICLIWSLLFTAILTESNRNVNVPGYNSVNKLGCTARLWPNSKMCGVDGVSCLPFDQTSFAFSCPAGCGSAQILEPHVVGDQEINYRSYVIGGPMRPSNTAGGVEYLYRGDSFICLAAIHAGIVKERRGGCGVLQRSGVHHDFPSVALNGITSISFSPSFPLSFTFTGNSHTCGDPQWILFALSVAATTLLGLFTTSGPLFFFPLFTITFFQTALASDAPFAPSPAALLSTAFARFLPATTTSFLVYHFCARRALHGLAAPWEKTLLYLAGTWFSALNQYTFDRLPISRLTPHDIAQQPGAVTALLAILLVLTATVLLQAHALRVEGRLPHFLCLYATLAACLAVLALAFPGLDLRLHHYIIALLLLPGTAVRTRPSLFFQGLLLGMFANGIARWGFDSILQTPAELLGEGLLESALPRVVPTTAAPSASNPDAIRFVLADLAAGWDGLAVMVNDVLRYQWSAARAPLDFNWTREVGGETAFFRFAFTEVMEMGGLRFGDFTAPATWFANGTWIDGTS